MHGSAGFATRQPQPSPMPHVPPVLASRERRNAHGSSPPSLGSGGCGARGAPKTSSSAEMHAKVQALVPQQRKASNAATMLSQTAPDDEEAASTFQLPRRIDIEESLPWQDKSAIRWDHVNW